MMVFFLRLKSSFVKSYKIIKKQAFFRFNIGILHLKIDRK